MANVYEAGRDKEWRDVHKQRIESYQRVQEDGTGRTTPHFEGDLLMRKFWAEEENSDELEPVLDQEELDGVSEETEAVISRKDLLLSGEEEQLLLPGGAGSVISNRDVQVQLSEPGPISNTDVTVQTDGDTEIEDLRRKNETMAKELANKQAVIEEHQLVDYYQSIQELKAELKMAQEKNYVQNQMESALAKKEIEAHDELKSILLAENEVLKISNKEQSFLNKELAVEKIKLEKELMEARANDQKRSQGHQRLVEELQGEFSKALVQNHELKEAVFTVTKKNDGLREQLENKVKREKNLNGKIVRMTNVEDQMKKELSAAKDDISSLKSQLQKRDLENVIKDEGMGDVERCEAAAEDDKTVVVVKEEKQEGPTRKLLVRKPKKKKPKRDKFSWAPLGPVVPVLETSENKVHNERTQEEKIQNN
ncbi:M protein, serotype 5-like [Palaemon carinicauda]|uniref:M protein, serotype 5-like n=1 Tax=Palaemon carinicauda TaxID=392227 RepID=UPI0035B688DA